MRYKLDSTEDPRSEVRLRNTQPRLKIGPSRFRLFARCESHCTPFYWKLIVGIPRKRAWIYARWNALGVASSSRWPAPQSPPSPVLGSVGGPRKRSQLESTVSRNSKVWRDVRTGQGRKGFVYIPILIYIYIYIYICIYAYIYGPIHICKCQWVFLHMYVYVSYMCI